MYVKNPGTGRNIKIGGKVWKMLISNGILENKGLERNEYADIVDPGKRMPLYEAKTEEQAEIAEKMIKEDPKIAKSVGITKGTYIKKIGKKLVKVSKKTSPTDMAEYTAVCASKMLDREMESLAEEYEEQILGNDELAEEEVENFQQKLKRLILEEMLKSAQKNKIEIEGGYTGTDYELETVE